MCIWLHSGTTYHLYIYIISSPCGIWKVVIFIMRWQATNYLVVISLGYTLLRLTFMFSFLNTGKYGGAHIKSYIREVVAYERDSSNDMFIVIKFFLILFIFITSIRVKTWILHMVFLGSYVSWRRWFTCCILLCLNLPAMIHKNASFDRHHPSHLSHI